MGQIHYLVEIGDVKALEKLLQTHDDAGSLANQLDNYGQSPLFVAVGTEAADPVIVRMLLEAGARVDFELVHPPVLFAKTYTERTIDKALKTGNLPIVKLFATHGADFHYIDSYGYNAILNAAYAAGDPTEVVEYLLGLGVSVNARSSYGETPLLTAMNQGKYRLGQLLVASGADEAVMDWTPLIRAVALGMVEDVERELAKTPDIEALDATGRTALHVALKRGNAAMVEALLAKSASIKKLQTRFSSTCLHLATESGQASLVLRMIEAGCPIDEKDFLGHTALATAAAEGDHEMVRLLLKKGANPSGGRFDSILSEAKDRETILILLEAGADPAELDTEGRRKLLGMGEASRSALSTVSSEQYLAARYEREGNANPEDITDPFRLAMIRAGANAYSARDQFGDEPTFACNLSWKSRPPQVWCFDRFGQTFTLMPDGRAILIAGEHEDSYDPDFCIYNDVTVFYPDGEIKIFGYPRDVFEPTDFHSATLVGDFIWIIGGFGYPDQRRGPIPVYRLDTRDYSIERMETSGEVPQRILEHRAKLSGNVIEIRGGKAITFKGEKERHYKNQSVYQLDTGLLVWKRVKG